MPWPSTIWAKIVFLISSTSHLRTKCSWLRLRCLKPTKQCGSFSAWISPGWCCSCWSPSPSKTVGGGEGKRGAEWNARRRSGVLRCSSRRQRPKRPWGLATKAQVVFNKGSPTVCSNVRNINNVSSKQPWNESIGSSFRSAFGFLIFSFRFAPCLQKQGSDTHLKTEKFGQLVTLHSSASGFWPHSSVTVCALRS